jgi:ubiquinone/menaquinone biosynthesis C-methylase UbiE
LCNALGPKVGAQLRIVTIEPYFSARNACCSRNAAGVAAVQCDGAAYPGRAMTISEQQSQAFKDFERTGWAKQAEYYDSLVGQMTRQAVDPLLAVVNARSGVKLLDVASGPGYVAAEATRRGLDALGTDIAGDMVNAARRRFTKAKFEVADAENLSYGDASFDAVTCAFGMLHFPRPGKAVAEAYRVLRPNGRFAFSVWCGAAKAKVLTLIAEAVQRHADGSVVLPPGPGIFTLSDPWVLSALMEAAKFTDVRVEELPCFFVPASSSELFDMMRKSMVRATYVYERQTADAQHRIEQTIKDEAAKALAAGNGKIPCPAFLVSGKKSR